MELKKLQTIDDLSPSERARWRSAQIKAGALPKYWTSRDEEQLFENQRFAKTYGIEAFKKTTREQRVLIEEYDLKLLNDTIIRDTIYNEYSPFNDDGTVNPNKGVGDADLYYKILNMDPLFLKELYESDWKFGYKLEELIDSRKKSAHKDINERTAFFAGFDPEMARVTAMERVARDVVIDEAQATEMRGKNKNIFDSIYNKDLAKKKKENVGQIQKEYDSLLLLNDEQMNLVFIDTIFPKKGESLGIPQLAAYYNKDGTIKSDEVENMTMDEKRRIVAEYNANIKTFGMGTAYDMMDKEAKDYISNHQDWADKVQKFGSDFAIATAAYAADMMNGTRHLWIKGGEYFGAYDSEEAECYVDAEGRYLGKEYVHNIVKDGVGQSIYIDPYSGEQIPVRKTTAKRSTLDDHGIAPDGTTRGYIFNNRYWSDAEATGSFDREEHAQAKALNGYSPHKMVYKLGEDQSYIWEIFKMGSFAAADMALAVAPGGVGLAGKGFKTLGTMGKTANISRKALKGVGTGLEFTSKALNEIKPFYASTGMAHMMGRGTLEESITDNMSAIDNLLRSEGLQEYLKIMAHKSMETADPMYNSEMESKQLKAHDDINNLAKMNYDKWRIGVMEQNDGKDPESLMSTKEIEDIKNSFKEAATREYAESYINEYVEKQKTTDRYKLMVDQAAESASDAAFTLATTTGILYGLVNAWGYRRYLYKDPTKRILSTASKRIRDAFSDPTTGKLTVKSIYDGVTKGQNIANFAKVGLSQMAKEGIEEAVDELHTYGAKLINEDAMSKYLNNEFSADAEARTYSMWEGMSSYFLGAAKGLSETSTYEAATIGALSGGFNVFPNILAIISPDFRERWNKAREEKRSWLELANMLVNNGILNTYYDQVEGEREAKKIVQLVNHIVDKSDNFKALARGLAMNQAKLGDLSPDEEDALEFMKATQIINQLQDFSKEEANTLLGAASKRSNVFKTALEQVDKILNDKYTEEDARDMLVEYYAKNPSVPQSEENSKKALEQIKLNATKLKKGVEVVNLVNKHIDSYEKRTGKKVSPLVKAQLSERMALNQFLDERIADNEEKISGNRNVNTQHNASSYGTREGVKNRISDLDHTIGDLTDVVEGNKKTVESKKAELDLYLESIKDNEELTSEEQKKLGKLMMEHKAAELDLRIAEANRNKVITERNSLMSQEESWQEGKVMSKDEILSAHPEDRARMLNNSNRHNYSAELLELIDLAKQELNNKDEGLLEETIPQQSININTHNQNKLALSSIMEDPEAALVNMMTRTSHSELIAANDRHNAQAMDSFIENMESDENIDPSLYDETIYLALLQHHNIIDGIFRYKRGTTYNKYGHVLDRAKKADTILRHIENYAIDNGIEGEAMTEIVGTSKNILLHTLNEEEFIEKLGEIVHDLNVPNETRERLSNVLNTLEEVFQHLSNATRISKEEAEKRRREKEEKKKKEKEKKLKEERELEKDNEAEQDQEDENNEGNDNEEDSEEDNEDNSEDNDSSDSLEDNNEDELDSSSIPDLDLEGTDDEKLNDLESPSIDELIASDDSGDISKMDTPNVDTSNLDLEIKETESNTLLGNPLYRYDKDDARIGILRKRKGSKPNDPMNRRFNWFENEGIKLQEIIDSELHHIAKLGVKIYPLYVNPLLNATDDAVFKDDILWVVEYTDLIKRIHNNDLGGVITANGKLFLIIGQGGYGNKTTEQFNNFNTLRNSQKRKKIDYFRNNPSERFYANTSVHTQIESISSGYLVKQQSTDSEIKSRPVTELLEGDRNPRGNKVDIEDLKWGIAYKDLMITVNVSEEQKSKVRALKNNTPGSVYLLVEAADGKLTPAYIKPLYLAGMRDGALKNEIVTLLNELSSTDHAVRLHAVTKLSHYLYFSKGGDQILVGTSSKPTISIQKNGTIIKTFDLSQPNVRTELVQFIIEEFNPRINITAPILKLEATIMKYAEAGALDTDIAQLGTSNASYNVYTIGEDGKPEIETIINSSNDNIGGSDLFDSVATDIYSTTFHGKTAVKDSNGSWKLNGKPVTDAALLSQLEYHYNLDSRNISPAKVTDEGEFYVILDDINNPVIYIKKGDYIKSLKGDAAKKVLSEIRLEQEEIARQERIKAEQEKENEIIDLDDNDDSNTNNENNDSQEDEILSEEDLLNLLLGNFEDSSEEKSIEELKAEDKVSKILADSEKLELTEDEHFYRDTETGELYARVTSIEHADVTSKPEDRFDPDNPYSTPSTSIGNGVDKFIRDFFDGTLGAVNSLAERYPNATTEDLLYLLEQLKVLKQKLGTRRIKIESKGIKAIGTVVVTDKNGVKKSIKVAGTLDLLGYDSDGNFYVFDVKTNRSMPDPDTVYGKKKLKSWASQTSLYKEFLEKKYNIKVKALAVIPVKVNYPTPVGAKDRLGEGTTTYTKDPENSNLLHANRQEYREAKPYLFPMIALDEILLDIRYEKLLPYELKIVMDLAESKGAQGKQNSSLQKDESSSNKDVNNANASLAELLTEDELKKAEDILYSVEYGGRFLAILEKKIQEGWPAIEDMDVLNDFLVEKGIEVTNIITSPDVWLDMVENCR